MTHEDWMRLALAEARHARSVEEVPIGAVIVSGKDVVGRGFNQPVTTGDPTAHAEIVALRAAARRLQNYRLPGSVAYVTIEPCLMCVGALLNARVAAVVYGAPEPKFGAVRSVVDVSALAVNHQFAVVSGVLEPECRSLLQEFFRARRAEA
jgi:tRNA(adenine34) deaminase